MSGRDWGNGDSANNVPLWVSGLINKAPTANNVSDLYKNSSNNNLSLSAVGVFPTNNGWVLRRAGTGGRAGRVTNEILFSSSTIAIGQAVPSLNTLTLAANSILENTASGTVISAILGVSVGSNLSFIDSAGNRFAISGTNLTAGPVATDYETATTHTITIRETNGSVFKDTTLTITVNNVYEQPNLSALSLSTTTFQTGTSYTVTINGATAGSTITASGLPAGLTLNSAARTITGTPTTSGTPNIVLTESLSDSANSPKVNSPIAVTITDPPNNGLISDVQIMANLTDVSSITKPPVTIGDIIPLYTNGWVLKVTLSSLVSIDPLKVTVSVDRPGFNNKVPTTRRDLAIGTGVLRRAYPNDGGPLSAGTNSFYITLDNQIFAPDTIYSVSFGAEFYPGSPSITYSGTVGRNDNVAYPNPIVRIAAPPHQVTSNTVSLDVTGVSNFARLGRQFDAVEAWCRVGGVDGPSVSTQTMQRSRYTPSSGRLPGKPFPAYQLDPDSSSLADGLGGVRVRVYPFCGPVWESWVSGSTFPTPNVEAELPFIKDAAGKYSQVYAWVNQDGTAATTVTGSASGTKLTVTAITGAPIAVGTVLYTGSAKRTVTAFQTGSGGTGDYTTSESGIINAGTLFSTGNVQTTSADPGANASFATFAHASYAIQSYNNSRTGGLAHNDPDGGVIMLRDVTGSVYSAAAGSYSTRNIAVTGGTLVPVEVRASSGTTSQLCRLRGTLTDNSSMASLGQKGFNGRFKFVNITFDSGGVATASDNTVIDGGNGSIATKSGITTYWGFVDCDVLESTLGNTTNCALSRCGYRYDIRTYSTNMYSAASVYTASYQMFAKSMGSSYVNTNVTNQSFVMPFTAGVTLTGVGIGAQGKITLADGGEIISTYLHVNTRIDCANNTSGPNSWDTPVQIDGVGMLNFFFRQGSTPNQTGIRMGGDGSTGIIKNSIIHHSASDGGFGSGNASSASNARWNVFYNDQVLSAIEKYGQIFGCVIPSFNNKTDNFTNNDGISTVVFTPGTRYYLNEIANDNNATTSQRAYYVYVGPPGQVAVAGDQSNTSLWKFVGNLYGTVYDRNPIKTGNWKERNQVGCFYNVVANSADGALRIPLPFNGFAPEKLGRGSVLATNYTNYYKNPTGGGTFTATQYGDYRPKSIDSGDSVDSPLLNQIPANMHVVPFDLDGNPRRSNGTGAAGPFERA